MINALPFREMHSQRGRDRHIIGPNADEAAPAVIHDPRQLGAGGSSAHDGASTYLNWENDKVEPEVRYSPCTMAWLGYDPFPAPATLADKLLRCRRMLGLSQEALARKLSVDEGTLSRWERAIWQPGRERRQRVEQLLTQICRPAGAAAGGQ